MDALKGRHASGSEQDPGRGVADPTARALSYADSDLQAETYSSIVHSFNLHKHSKQQSFLSDQKHNILCFKEMLPPLPAIYLSILEYGSQGNN